MADNFKQFSEEIADLTAEEAEWIRTELDATPDSIGKEKARVRREQVIRDEYDAEDAQCWPDFEWEILEGDGPSRLWIHADDYGSVQDVGGFIRAFLEKFRPSATFFLSWADTCSKMRVGEFDGGAIFVTAESVEYLQASSWAQFKAEEWAKSRCSSSN